MFRDHLLENETVRDDYAALKQKLLQADTACAKNNSLFSEYTLKKGTFIRQVLRQAGFKRIRILKCNDNYEWNSAKLFMLLARQCENGKVVIVLDEISWMGSKDPDFLGKLKNAWDLHFKKNDQLMLMICGSASNWIEKNIISSTGFVGRISYTLTLDELPLDDCAKFWGHSGKNIAALEKIKLLSVTGGVPRYLEEVDPHKTAEKNIKDLCFTKGGMLVEEFEHIFSDLFTRDSAFYRKIVIALAKGAKEISDICDELQTEQSGRITEYLTELVLAGFITRDYTWDLATGADSKLSKYRLSDNYLRFYLKYIAKYYTKILRNTFKFKSLSVLPEWSAIIGLQFENLVLNSREYIHAKLAIDAQDIISENPFFQRKTTVTAGCQIDYMIQTRFNCLYICEIKFSHNKIGMEVIDEVQKKIYRIKRPRGFSYRPVLIYAGNISDPLKESDYFAKIIDFAGVFAGATV